MVHEDRPNKDHSKDDPSKSGDKNEEQNSSVLQRSQILCSRTPQNIFFENDLLQQVRRRTFSHWPHYTTPSSAQMIEAGFFNCNVGDRVISVYCNLICQQWTPHTDDPCEVHKTLSPNCIYVKAKLIRSLTSSIIIVNEHSTGASNGLIFTDASNPTYYEVPKRHASFATWPHENLPSVDDLVRAGFSFTGTKTTVTCFHCTGSLQNWGSNDNLMIEHARWFPHCVYAKQLCGDELYRKIQESKRGQRERARANEAKEKGISGVALNATVTTNSRQLLIPNESTLSRLIAARLDLPISQRLLDRNFKLSIIKRCWEDQLRLKQDDFVSACDLHIACLILQKQIEHIDGKKENIVIPSLKMRQIREQEEKERKVINFPEEREKTIKREKSFLHWPHSSPSRIDMFTAGWSLDGTKSRDYTRCSYCGLEYDNWQSKDNPWTIHRQLSPSCPFLLADQSILPSSVRIKTLNEVYRTEKINSDATQSTSHLILTSTSPYRFPPQREDSFLRFPGGSSIDIAALVRSGFYYMGFGTNLQCYHCRGIVNDFHRYPSNEIDTRHRSQFSHCRFAQLLPQQGETPSINNADLCVWCLTNPKELAIYPCMHLAICGPCTQWISLCPTCGTEAEAFFRLFT